MLKVINSKYGVVQKKVLFCIVCSLLLTSLNGCSHKKSAVSAKFDSLSRGQMLFEKHCETCHKLPDPHAHSWDEWINIMVAMAHNAKLNDVERALILQYLITYGVASVPRSNSHHAMNQPIIYHGPLF